MFWGFFQRFRKPRWIMVLLLGIALIALVLFHVLPSRHTATNSPVWGVTFNAAHARYLGLDWKKTYQAVLDDLGVRWIRIGVPWDEIEGESGVLWLDDIRWQLDEASKRGAHVLLAIGRKLPRWPECRVPGWAENLPVDQQNLHVLTMIRALVQELKPHSVIWGWQVENEPLFTFGNNCPRPDIAFLEQEIGLVRALDTRPVIGTDSGELSFWWQMSGVVDVLGVSIYRATNHSWVGPFVYPFSPGLYERKGRLVGARVPRIIVTEVQLEPWAPNGILNLDTQEQKRIFSVRQFQDNIAYVRDTGFDTFYAWGVEWWAWMKQKQDAPEYWDEAKKLFH